MKRWIFVLCLLLATAGLGYWAWRAWFPGPELVIRQRLTQLSRTASFSGEEGTLAKLAGAQALTAFCTPDIEITVDVPGHSRHTISGHDELLQAAAGARSLTHGLRVQFFDILVTLSPDRNSAVAELTARANVTSEKDYYVQELKFALKKVEGKWLIHRAETVKVLTP